MAASNPGERGEHGESDRRPGLLTQRLLALFVGGLLLLDFPLLVPALGQGGGSATLLGLPRLPLLLFAAFALLIALLAVLMERDDKPE
jgi:hypothetical protein